MSREIGKIGEDLACKILAENGYKIIARNYFTRFGEIDIVAKENNEIVFIEVKYRKNEGFGTVFDVITKQKLRKIYKSALIYLNENNLNDADWRVDAVGIDLGTDNFNILKNIFVEGM